MLDHGLVRLNGQLKKLNGGLGFSVGKDGAITAAGAELLPELDRIFFDPGRHLDALRDRHQTRLVIGGSGVFTREHLPAILERALESAGDFTVVSQNRSEPELIASLERGGLQRHLRRLGLRILKTEACALGDVAGYVATGKYLGLSLMEPNLITHPGVRAIPLKKSRPIDIGVVWRPTHTALERRILELLEARAGIAGEIARRIGSEIKREDAKDRAGGRGGGEFRVEG